MALRSHETTQAINAGGTCSENMSNPAPPTSIQGQALRRLELHSTMWAAIDGCIEKLPDAATPNTARHAEFVRRAQAIRRDFIALTRDMTINAMQEATEDRSRTVLLPYAHPQNQ